MAVKMTDLRNVPSIEREAIAKGTIHLFPETIDAIKNSRVERGEVLAAAQIAGIHGIKSTCTLIPMCHQIPLSHTDIQFRFKRDSIVCTCTVAANYNTGIEMEALIGVTTALLTIWDMVKYMEKDEKRHYQGTKITDISVDVRLGGEEIE